jgi:hypothetical protein
MSDLQQERTTRVPSCNIFSCTILPTSFVLLVHGNFHHCNQKPTVLLSKLRGIIIILVTRSLPGIVLLILRLLDADALGRPAPLLAILPRPSTADRCLSEFTV